MGNRIVMMLLLPEPKTRKRPVRATQKHRDKSRYTRNVKHKAADWRLWYFLRTEAMPKLSGSTKAFSG